MRYLYFMPYIIWLYLLLIIVTCRPFLGNELANTFPRFLDTNRRRMLNVSMDTKKGSCRLNRSVAAKVTHVSMEVDS
jgi:hypothetical protein